MDHRSMLGVMGHGERAFFLLSPSWIATKSLVNSRDTTKTREMGGGCVWFIQPQRRLTGTVPKAICFCTGVSKMLAQRAATNCWS